MDNPHDPDKRSPNDPKHQHSAGVPFGLWALGIMFIISLVTTLGGGGGGL